MFFCFRYRMCSSVLQDYVDKESLLLDLKTEKLELAQGNSQSNNASAAIKSQRSGNSLNQEEEDASVDNSATSKSIRQPVWDISAIEMNEGILVKQVQSLTPIIYKQILNNF